MNNNSEESIYEKVIREHKDKNKELPVPLNELDSIEKIIDVLKYVPLTMAQRDIYEDKLKILRDEQGALETARMKGLEEGRKIGLEKWIMEGSRKATVEMAKKSLEIGLSEEIIMNIIKLSKEELINIKSGISS